MQELQKKYLNSLAIASDGGAASEAFLSMFLLYFYNQVLGLDPFLCGLGIALYLFVDAFTDPMIGWISGNEVKGQMAEVYAFLMMAFGLSLGPQITAFFTDFVLMDESNLGYAMALTGALVLPIAFIFFKISTSSYKKAYEELSR